MALKTFWFRSWWVVIFVVLTIAFYFQSIHRRSETMREVSQRVREIEQTKVSAAEERDELTRRLQSESDPAWMEMVLMKELGVVPEGWTKVHFTQKK